MSGAAASPVTSATATAGPSIALTKYWGKTGGGVNLPATPSLGVTLDTFQSRARVALTTGSHRVTLNGVVQPLDRFTPFLEAAARYFGTPLDEHTIVPLDSEDATIYPTRFSDWTAAQATSGAR